MNRVNDNPSRELLLLQLTYGEKKISPVSNKFSCVLVMSTKKGAAANSLLTLCKTKPRRITTRKLPPPQKKMTQRSRF